MINTNSSPGGRPFGNKVPILLVLTEIIHGNFPILNKTPYRLKKTFLLFIVLILLGCRNDTELAMERGIQYYEWEKIEEAILEFKHVIYSLNSPKKTLKHEGRTLLSRAHYNLAVAYAKKKWYTEADEEARKAFALIPSDDNRKVLELIQRKISTKTGPRPGRIDTSSQ